MNIEEQLNKIISLLERIAPPERVKAPTRDKESYAPMEVVMLYNHNFKNTNAVMKSKPTAALINRLRSCISTEFKDTEEWKRYFDFIKESPFLMGNVNSDRPFKLKLEWIIKPENLAKILEGVYHGR